jgi:hypothetical protein
VHGREIVDIPEGTLARMASDMPNPHRTPQQEDPA